MRIKELRVRYGFLQSEIAERLHVSCSTLSSWERGLSSPPFEKQRQLANIFFVSVDYLMGFSNVRGWPPDISDVKITSSQQAELDQLKQKASELEQENARLVAALSKEKATALTAISEKENAKRELERKQYWSSVFKAACVFLAWGLIISISRIGDLQEDVRTYKQKAKNLTEQVNILSDQVLSLAGRLPKSIPTTSTSRAPLSAKDATIMVWIPATGKRYHDSKACAGNSPREVTLAEAKARGYTSCGRCDPPY